MNVRALLKDAAAVLRDAGVADPPREAASLLCLTLKKDRTFLFAHPEYELTMKEEALSGVYLARRANREPLQYIRGSQEFYGLEFEVSPSVLIPRPETEHLVEAAIELLKSAVNPLICDVGTGSGCIPVSILNEIGQASGVGLDISPEALKVAGRNAARHGLEDRLEFKESNVFAALSDEKFDMIVSNPPYIPLIDFNQLQPEVRAFEPLFALTDGEDGLSIIRTIVNESPRYLKPGGYLLMEIGFSQAEEAAALFDRGIWQESEILPDLQSIPRVVTARLA